METTALLPTQMDECATFWWSIYRELPYVHRPDGYQTWNTPPVGPDYFSKHLGYGLESDDPDHANWPGELSCETILVAQEHGRVCGIIVSSVDHARSSGLILSGYVHRDAHGRRAADALVAASFKLFRDMGLKRARIAPTHGSSMEVECPLHLALLDAGCAWDDDWWPAAPQETYGVFLGGSLAAFSLTDAIQAKIDRLAAERVDIRRVTPADALDIRRMDDGSTIDPFAETSDSAYVAFVDGLAVGWTVEVWLFEDEGRLLCMVTPKVIPTYRRRGIGMVLEHLGVAEAVDRGAIGGWTATGIYNPARLIYRSTGWKYWYTCYSRMTKRLQRLEV